MVLEKLLQQRTDIWRGSVRSAALPSGVASGFPALDAELPGGGWPEGALSEILCDGPGAFALTLPALARQSRAGRWLVLVAPPYVPYAPALAARGVDLARLLLVCPEDEAGVLWAAEQGLRSGVCGAVLAWAEPHQTAVLRRLQLAAEAGASLAFLFRTEAAADRPSPAALRLRVRSAARGLEVRILKRRGGFFAGVLQVEV
jgi:hypothetical protein